VSQSCDAPARTVRACTLAGLTLVLLLALRARSDGETPSLLVILGSFVLVSVLARPFTSRERSWPVVFAGLVGAQLVLHVAFLFASTGQIAHVGNAGLFCSPASTSPVSSCAPTERGGLLLLGVQLLAAALFALWARGADAVGWQLARRPWLALLRFVARVVSVLCSARINVLPHALNLVAPQAESPRFPRSPLVAREHGRRGPPRHEFIGSVLAVPAATILSF